MKMFGVITRRNVVLLLMLWILRTDFVTISEGKMDVSEVSEGGMKSFADRLGVRDEEKSGTCEKAESNTTVAVPLDEYLGLLKRNVELESYTHYRKGYGECKKIYDHVMERLEAINTDAEDREKPLEIISAFLFFIIACAVHILIDPNALD